MLIWLEIKNGQEWFKEFMPVNVKKQFEKFTNINMQIRIIA